METQLAQDRILASLGDAELHHALGRDLDRRASRGIAAHASLAVHEDEFAQSGNGETIFGMLVSEFGLCFEKTTHLNFGELGGIREVRHDIALGKAFFGHVGVLSKGVVGESPSLSASLM